MNKRDALIIALKTVGGFSDIIVNDVDLSIYSDSDKYKIIEEIDNVCKGLKTRANKLSITKNETKYNIYSSI